MAETQFTIASFSQSLKVATEHVFADHDELNYYIIIPVNFSLHTRPNEKTFDLLPLDVRLLYGGQLLSEAKGSRMISVQSVESNSGYQIRFKLNKPELNYIEKQRQDDIPFTLDFNIHTFIWGSGPVRDYTETIPVIVQFTIPQSVWTNKLLPALGFRHLKLFEIPLSHDSLKEPYDHVIVEFNKAESYFKKQDYNKCVAHCRSTMDILNQQLKLIKDQTKSGTAFKWFKTVDQATLDWIEAVFKANQAITSKAHHPGTHNDFDRYQAESIYLVVLGLMNFVGHLAK